MRHGVRLHVDRHLLVGGDVGVRHQHRAHARPAGRRARPRTAGRRRRRRPPGRRTPTAASAARNASRCGLAWRSPRCRPPRRSGRARRPGRRPARGTPATRSCCYRTPTLTPRSRRPREQRLDVGVGEGVRLPELLVRRERGGVPRVVDVDAGPGQDLGRSARCHRPRRGSAARPRARRRGCARRASSASRVARHTARRRPATARPGRWCARA